MKNNWLQIIPIILTVIVLFLGGVSSFYYIQASAKDELQNLKLKVTENYITKEEFREYSKKLDLIEDKINYIDKKLNIIFVKMQINMPE